MSESYRRFDCEDRKFTEASLNAGLSLTFISKKLGFHETTVGREVKRNAILVDRVDNSVTCTDRWRCVTASLCGASCGRLCKDCTEHDCTKICDGYAPRYCPLLKKKPHVCNGCGAYAFRGKCNFVQVAYDARGAQERASLRASESRSGVNVTSEEMVAMVEKVKPLLDKGQSPNHIWITHEGEFPVSCRTFYDYVDAGVLEICSMDLPKKVKYKKRKGKPKTPASLLNPLYDGRRIEDWEALSGPERSKAVEMDCVEGSKGSVKVVLTLMFTAINYQLMVLLEEHTASCVVEALDDIEAAIGLEAFREHIPYLKTDHGHEFNNFAAIERSCTDPSQKRCRVYYCDPNRPDQKAGAERNHVELRKLLPKKTSFKALDELTLSVVASNVNSYAREVLGGRTPVSLAKEMLPDGLIGGMGVEEIPAEEVILKPKLLPMAVEARRNGSKLG